MAYEPLHHKYRPQTFAELVGQEAIATTLSNALRQQKIAPAYLFTGARGTGKTSSARILAKSLNCIQSHDPTAKPCGVCEVCRSIANGSALDVIEIDAASNTGVDNIRELIERSQFAPVQCRYKVYVIDECLTGDTLVLTDRGALRIDDPQLQGKNVLSYNDFTGEWQFKPVLRWLDQGDRQIFTVETTHGTIRCTGNHLIRTESGWIAAKDLSVGTKILSPVNADAAFSSQKLAAMDASGVLPEAINSREILTARKSTTSVLWQQWTTNLAMVKSVRHAGTERVYDIEVEDNHNFVANGLLVHNCHMLSTAAFNALLKTLEEPPDRVVFVLATTDPQRVLPTIISRCQRFDFRRIELTAMVQHLKRIADRETIQITSEAVQLVGQIAQGGLRDAESMLDQLSLLEGEITVERVWDLVGAVPERDLLSLVQAIAQNDPTTVIDRVRHLMDRGREPLIVLQNLASFYRDLLIAKTTPDRQDLVAITPATWTEMTQFVQELSFDSILKGQQQLRASEVQVKNTTQPRLWLEVTILGLLPANQGVAEPSQTAPIRSTIVQPAIAPPKPVATTPVQAKPEPIPEPSPTPVASAEPTPTPIAPPPTQPIAPVPVAASPEIPQIPEEVAATVSSTQPQVDLEQMWQSVIEMLHPPGTQALFKQQGRLLALEATTARIGITSQPLFKMAQMRIANLEAALNQVTQHAIKVSLEVTATQSTPATVGEAAPPIPVPQMPTNQPIGRSNPSTNGQTNGHGSSHHGSSHPGPNNPGSSHPGSSHPAEAPVSYRSEAPTYESARPTPTPAVSEPTFSPSWQEEDAVTRAAKSLAQMFNGQIVSDFEEVPVAAIVETELSRTPELTEEAENGDPDDDVPF